VSINRGRVGRSFHQQAAEYDQHATVQKRVVNRLMSLVDSHVSGVPADILDIGCGTGQLLSTLDSQYPQSRLFGLDLALNMIRCAADRLGPRATLVNADAEQLPFRDGAFDLVVSTSTLQWIENIDVFFQECQRVVRRDGLLCIAFFGGRTLQELQESFREAAGQGCGGSAGRMDRLHRFREVTDVRDALQRSAFGSVLLFCETEMDYYPDVPELLRSIKRIGAGSAAQDNRQGGLGWRSLLNETSRLYRERYGRDGTIPVTYEVIYVIAQNRDRI
jgi:malonyl-CoA O-methyltransferase